MKMIFVLLASLSVSSFAMANIATEEVAAGSEVIIRQVLEKHLLPHDPALNRRLTMALEGSNGGEPVTIKDMSCDVGLGSRYCVIDFEQQVNHGGDEDMYAFGIRVRITQGRVNFAEFVPHGG